MNGDATCPRPIPSSLLRSTWRVCRSRACRPIPPERLTSRIAVAVLAMSVIGCGSGPLPPPPSSPAPTPVARPGIAPVPVTTSPSKSKPTAPQTDAPAPTTPARAGSNEPSVAKTNGGTPSNKTSAPRSNPETQQPKPVGRRVEGPAAAGHFVMALCRDVDGNVWVGTEDNGVLRGTPKGEWTQFTTNDGLGDDNGYALCCDRHGRIWVGQLNHGVAVFNGETWKTYDVLDGPLGERIFDIACCPTDGDVWMATSAGLSRYSESPDRSPVAPPTGSLNSPSPSRSPVAPSVGPISPPSTAPAGSPPTIPIGSPSTESAGPSPLEMLKGAEPSERASTGRWAYFTRADGLPSDQANALAFDSDGNLYVGTQCDGLAIAKAEDNYATWQVVSGEISDAKYRRPQGTGLPSPLINDVLVARDGSVYVATSLGLAKSKNRGQSWEYLRGRDYADKVKGRYEPPPKTWSPLPKEKMSLLLPEDYVTTLAEDDAGRLWLGFRQQGFAVIDAKSAASFHGANETAKLTDQYVAALLPDETGRALVGGYGGGLLTLKEAVPLASSKPSQDAVSPSAKSEASPTKKIPPHPALATAPTLEQLQSELPKLQSLKEPLPEVAGVFVGDDWKTQGDWVGHLGRQYTILCAMSAPLNDAAIADFRYRVRGGVGPNGGAFGRAKKKRELLRHWVHRRRWDDPRVLYNPMIGYRRQADWDDHGEAYPMSHEGPDVWASVVVPEGLHQISLYFFNKDGHDGHNRYRS
jgi:Two component regulator propeller